MKKIAFILALIASAASFGQKSKSTKTGKTTLAELQMKNYAKDTTAFALVLYEHSNLYMDRKTYDFKTDYYFRKKIFTKEAKEHATIKITTFKKEKVMDVQAITYNLGSNGEIERVSLQASDVFTTKVSENYSETVFTLPNIKEGSVIEYVYSILSPYPQLDDWYFQSDIPKLKSEYSSAILGNYRYKVRLTGGLTLSKNDVSVLKRCIYIDGIGQGACAVRSYSMTDIPAFKEEDYMLSKRNYVSRLSFDYESFTNGRGITTKYLTDWGSADKSLKKYFLNNQSNKKSFFKKRLPEYITALSNPLEKAKAIYSHIQDAYSWNGKYWSRDEKMRDIFTEKSGSVNAINLALHNSLQALDIESYVVMLSTRKHGLPTKLYPIFKDFNYIIVKAKIDGKEYFLDATNKYLPFGMLPLKCLNGDVRVMDFKKGSYWESIRPSTKTRRSVKAIMKFEEDGELKGNILISSSGYFGVSRRSEVLTFKESELLESFEEKNPFLEVDTYKETDAEKLDTSIKEVYKVVYSDDEPIANPSTTRIYPFLVHRVTKNPFTSETRDYPVDYGFARKHVYSFTLSIPSNYVVTKLPENVQLGLPNKGGSLIFKTNVANNTINFYFAFNLTKKLYSSEEYYYLKEIYNKIIQIQASYIELEKK